MIDVTPEIHRALAGVTGGDADAIADALQLRETEAAASGLDARTFGLVRVAALIAMDAPPASYAWQVAEALEGGATPEDILGVLRALAPQVGSPRVVAAAPELMLALGLTLPGGREDDRP
jgi:alkylhydroperoxidase/carboxymuconolactone decarboxylase family protein YurZ